MQISEFPISSLNIRKNIKYEEQNAKFFIHGTNKFWFSSKYLLLQWFDANLVVRNILELSALFRSLLRADLVNQVSHIWGKIESIVFV